MSKEMNFSAIQRQYPETISKEQLCKLCHISKRMAKYYLDNGIIPCVNTGHGTYKYKIKTDDVIAFLRNSMKVPEKYRVRVKRGEVSKPEARPSIRYNEQVMHAYKKLLLIITTPYPDLMGLSMIAELTGYSIKTVLTWADYGHIRWFKEGRRYLAPKELVIKHMLSEEYQNIIQKSERHYELIRQLIDMVYTDGGTGV